MAEFIAREALQADIRESYLKLQEIYETLRYERERDICSGELGTFCEILMRIKDFPAADVAPVVHGLWRGTEEYINCSECGMPWNCCDNETQSFRYCPNCGARMDGDGHADD